MAVFAYNFPHKKTQDFLTRLLIEGYDIDCVLAADSVVLNIPAATVRVGVRHTGLVHPKQICDRFGIDYHVVVHNDSACENLLRDRGIDIGIIAGARILKEPAINAVNMGIINWHPGILPEVRGLDTLQWALVENLPLGVTAHVIDKRVDCGRILLKEEIAFHPDDTLPDLSLRLYETQLSMIAPAIEKLRNTPLETLEEVGASRLYRKMPPELEAQVADALERRKRATFAT
ncbi:MAG TPA: formyltransferase family protein [Thermoanaerobaculia bacterium]|nr:formyltransferase family protein [Thermoanaerobaculia bacterium]